MTTTVEEEQGLIDSSSKQLETCEDASEMLRLQCLKRGAGGIKGIGRAFRIMDDDGNRSLSLGEFKEGVTDYGLSTGEDDLKRLFEQLDKDNSGSLNFEEFLQALRALSSARKDIINKVFELLT